MHSSIIKIEKDDLEKQANNLRKTMLKKIILLAFLALVSLVNAQEERISLGQGKKYTIGGIEVTGAKRYNEQTILTTSGLKPKYHERHRLLLLCATVLRYPFEHSLLPHSYRGLNELITDVWQH